MHSGNSLAKGVLPLAIPECIAQRYYNDTDMIRFKVKTNPLWYPVSLAWSTENPQSDEAREFLNFIADNIPEGYFYKDVDALLNS